MSLWIKTHQTLKAHPKTRRAARAAGVSVPAMIGHLVCLWTWALDHAKEDGALPGAEPEDVEIAALWHGTLGVLMQALVSCGAGARPGFVVDNDGALSLHDWADYAGDLHRRREANRKHKRASRARAAGQKAQPDGQPDSQNADLTVPPSDERRGEKRRGEERTSGQVPLAPYEEPKQEQRACDSPAGNLSQWLLDHYPHGWDDNGIHHVVTPMDVENALAKTIRGGSFDPQAIMDGSARLAKAKKGPSRRYVIGLVKWIDSRGWEARIKKASDADTANAPSGPNLIHEENLQRVKKTAADRRAMEKRQRDTGTRDPSDQYQPGSWERKQLARMAKKDGKA